MSLGRTRMDSHEDSTSGKSSDHRQRTKVMVSITTPSRVPEQRAPVDVVLVLHVQIRLIAPPNWQSLLVKATRVVFEKLGELDRLAIVPASLMEETAVKPKFYEMSSVNKKRAIDAVEGSQAMRRNAPLLTDLESAESATYNRKSKENEDRAAHIIVISNSNEDLSSVVSWRFRSVHAFGFRDAHSGKKLASIASNSESTYGVFDEGDEISPAFAKSMEKITSGVEPLEVRLKCGQDVVLSAICAPRISYFISNDKKFGIIWASARRTAGTVTNFVVELQFPKLRWSLKPNRASGSSSGTHLSVEAKYGQHPNSKRLKGVCKELNKSVSNKVAAELFRMEAVKVVSDELTALLLRDKYDCKQLHEAADRLRQRWKSSLEPYLLTDEALTEAAPGLLAEIQEMETRLHNNYLWLEYMLSWKSQQRWPLPPLATAMDQHAMADDSLLRCRVLAQVDSLPEPIRKPRPGLVPVLVEVAVPVEGLAKAKRASIDLVLVLDVGYGATTSRETKNKRLGLLYQAMNFIKMKLSSKDRLAIIQVNQSGDCGKLHEPSKIKMDLKLRRAHHHRISNTDLSNHLTDAVKLLDGRREDNERLGLIILISDGDDISILHRPQRCKYTVHTFGLRGAGNSRTMHAIATASSGIYAIINDHQDKMSETFMACIRKITCTIAVNTRVNIICGDTSRLKLSAIESGQFESSISNSKEFGSIFAGALYAGAVKRFVAYLEKGQGFVDPRYLSSLFQVIVMWQSPHHDASRRMVTNKLQAQVKIIKGRPDKVTDDVVDKVTDEIVGKVADNDVDEITDDVVDEIARLIEMEIVSDVIYSETKVGEVLAGMVKKLRQDLKLLATDIRVRPKGSSYEFRVDEESLASLGTKNDPDGSQLSYILSWLSYQGLCEKPPSAPSRQRQDMRDSSQQDQQNISPEDELLASLNFT